MSELLTLSGVETHIGRYHILHGVELGVPEGKTTMLLGRNGAGKTTTLRTIMGLWRASRGEIALGGQRIEALGTPDIARAGIGYVPETMAVFSDLTVKENLVLAAREGDMDQTRLDWIFGFFPPLKKFWLSRAGTLSGGQKQMLSFARAFIEERKLLLIDEPTKGLAPAIIGALVECLKEVKRRGATILLVEQNFRVAQEIGDTVSVMDNGRVVHTGTMAELAADEALQHRLLGLEPGYPPMSAQDIDAGAALPKTPRDYLPLLLPVALALAALPFIPSTSTWVTLTIAALAMGMMIFVMASGLTLIFGLMDVLNFGHGAFIAIGAYMATLVLIPLAGWMQADSIWLNLAAVVPAVLFAMAVTGALGLAFERVVIMPVYGQHLKQILITMGGMIVAEQILYAFFGPQQIPLPLPTSLRGSFQFGEAAVEKYRVICVLVGLGVYLGMLLVLNRTKIGLLIRAGVENTEMVEALGYRITRLFVGVFMAGSALAGLGGVMWGLYREQVNGAMGHELTVLVFIVVIIGGLGSVTGCFIGALLVALLTNYAGFLIPKVSLIADILLMVVILLWRPRGLYPVTSR